MSASLKFVLEFVDQQTACVMDEMPFEVDSLELICAQLMIEPSNFDPGIQYELDEADIMRIKRVLKLDIQSSQNHVYLRVRRPVDDLPYKIHTNRELILMLSETKPLAAFVEDHPRATAYEVIPESIFEPYVLSGRFVKREKLYPGSKDAGGLPNAAHRRIRRVLYAQKNETWRIDAYLLLHETAAYSGWNDGFERMEGTLLGYEQWQNDAYIKMLHARRQK